MTVIKISSAWNNGFYVFEHYFEELNDVKFFKKESGKRLKLKCFPLVKSSPKLIPRKCA